MGSEVNERIGQNIKCYRLRKKLTQEELAQKTGISKSHVSYLEAGKKNISVYLVCRIAASLGVDVHVLLDQKEVCK
ncbi:Helix-turn-helix [Alteribacillus persepolensis]|uniref:Helix-turn-helix n=1 Tax=Alteribacillus persepolensis TaxID=568899 RepID=A0A1G8I620_9BACI|nr:helix-turn-helix transcriptional regulator [Alteribacillus persepolensis]SDI14272.1 Helix-turn-helix [Alteribacillus persepolensis]